MSGGQAPVGAPRFRAVILGCGSSGGVPRLGGPGGAGNWGACDPSDPRNARRRCALVVERQGASGVTRALVDAGPDLRAQLIDARIAVVDAVLFTHDHADHTNGLDDLRQIFLQTRERVAVYADAATSASLRSRFSYVFDAPAGAFYPPILSLNLITEAQVAGAADFVVEGAGGPIGVRPFRCVHGPVTALGFRFFAPDVPAAADSVSGLAYLPDANEIPEAAWDALETLEVWVVDALRLTPHPAHANLETALRWIDRARPRRAVLTNMHIDLDYAETDAATPAHVTPAHDGLEIWF